ncbi:MAG: hypothetical protein ACPGQS_11595, partial [Bradymonadia bacterium]
RILFESSSVKLFYGPEIFTQLIAALYGPTVEGALVAGSSQRRLLIESEDVYSAEQLSKLIVGVFDRDNASHVLHTSWSNAHEQNLFNASSRSSNQRAYELQNQRKYWILDKPHELDSARLNQLLQGFPAMLTAPLGDAQLLMTLADPVHDSSLDSDFRKVLGTHGIIQLETLNTRLNQGLPISEVVQTELNELVGEPPSEQLVRQLSARLINYHFPHHRRSLIALLAMTQARGLLSSFDELGFEQMLTQLEPVPARTEPAEDGGRLSRHIAEGLLAGQTLPELLYDFERQAYLHAARVCAMKRPHQNVRVQDLAHLLKTPRQTVSRKWHAFQIKPEEYRTEQ